MDNCYTIKIPDHLSMKSVDELYRIALMPQGMNCFISKLMKQPTAGGGILGQHHPGSSTIRA